MLRLRTPFSEALMASIMLDELEVTDVALIEHAILSFAPGLTVLTGETGAGKTALLQALKLVIGQRAESDMVRDGAESASVQATFALSADAAQQFDEECTQELEGYISSRDGGAESMYPVVITRRVSADGRSRCRIDGSMAAVGTLQRTIGPFIDLYGQHEHQTLLDVRHHQAYLDAFIGAELLALRTDYLEALDSYHRVRARLEEARAFQHNAAELCAQARYVTDSILKVAPQPDEYERLQEELPRLQYADVLAQSTGDALCALRGGGIDAIDTPGACDLIATSLAALEQGARYDIQLEEFRSKILDILYAIEDLSQEMRTYAESIEHDENTLNATLERLSDLSGLMKTFGPRMDDVFSTLASAERTIEDTTDMAGTLERLENEEQVARASLEDAAAALDAVRTAKQNSFCNYLAESASDLAMEGASFSFARTLLDFEQWGSAGPCRYELLYAPGPGVTPRPLTKIVSGGELSRIMLALKSLFNLADEKRIMVFDEIDTGIGGKTATAVADRLEHLAMNHQVIVVTHLPQIACRADRQLVVEKTVTVDHISTVIRHLDGEERVFEIARMLSGTDDETALEHARSLIKRTDG
jgi:DNA repair protein RecN (Recombination protein N)